jgi:hypothetical protein
VKDTLAIVGSHPRTRKEFDVSRTDCDIWVFNEAISNGSFPRADVVFQMHSPVIWKNPHNRNDPHHYEWLQSQSDITVYMQDAYPDVPMSTKYPLDEIIERFNIAYFTSSLSYALALAAYHGYKRVEVYGVEMETNTEYQYQRDGVSLWLGVLKGLGVGLDLHMSFFDQPLYGYQGEVSIPYEDIVKRIDELTPQIDTLEKEYTASSLMLQRILGDLISSSNDKDINEAITKQIEMSKRLGLLDGAKFENNKYKIKSDTMKGIAGEYLFSRQEFESGAANLQNLAAEEQTQVNFLSGQADLIYKSLMNAAKDSPKRGKLLDAYRVTVAEYLRAHNKAMIYSGAAQENYKYMARLDKGIRAAGGAKSEAVILEAANA